MRPLKRRRGYVLMVTLLVLTMAATLLVTVGQLAIGQARAAAGSEADLQRKWATRSARQALLSRAELLLAQAEVAGDRPVARIDRTIVLNDLSLSVVLCDEQAKANINEMLTHGGPLIVGDRLRSAWSGSGLLNQIHLRPLRAANVDQPRLGPPAGVQSFGQILENQPPQNWFLPTSVTQQITCWGSGAINIARADEAALRLALTPSLTRVEIRKLIEQRDLIWRGRSVKTSQSSASANGDYVQRLLDSAKIMPRDRAQLSLTNRSTCHGLWIVVKDRQRVWYNWYVLDESMPNRPSRAAFEW